MLVVVAAACSGSGPPVAESSQVLDCSNPIDIVDGPPEGWSAVLDVIAVPDDLVLQRGRLDGEIGRSFSKIGLMIRADQALTLSIAEASQPNALMGWNASANPTATIEIDGCAGSCTTDWQPGCPLGESGEWLVYPGGVWTLDPACIEVEIAARGETAIVELAIGAQCP